MKLLHIVIIVFPFVFCSCSHDKRTEHIVTDFEDKGTLVATEHDIPVPILLPRYIGISGDYLYVYKERENKTFVLFNLSDLSYIMETGNKGQGPNDFNLADTRSFTSSCDGFKVIEAGSGHLKDVVITSNGLVVRQSQRIFPKGMPSNGYYPLKDSIFLTLGAMDGQHEYSLINAATGEMEPVCSYPNWDGIMESQDYFPFIVFLKRCVVHPSQKKFAAFYSKFKRFRIFDSDMNLLHDINVQTDPCFTSFYDDANKWPVYYVSEPFSTHNLIFSLCSYNDTEKEGNSELHVWDWDGNPIGCYSLGRSISLMTIDVVRGRIIAMNVGKEDAFYVYDLPKKIKQLMKNDIYRVQF